MSARILIVASTGLLLRMLLTLCSEGSSDIRGWEVFAVNMESEPLLDIYRRTALANHPPLAFYYTYFAKVIADYFSIRFSVVYKLMPMLADFGTAIVLYHWVGAKRPIRESALALTFYSFAINIILVSCFHGNTDTICVFFITLSLYLLLETRFIRCAGLAMACALNVKVIPLLSIPPLLLSIRDPLQRRHFVFGLLFALIPPLIFWNTSFGYIAGVRVFGYRSLVEPWGVYYWIFELNRIWDSVNPLIEWYHNNGRWFIIAGTVVLCLLNLTRHRLSPVASVALSLGIWFLFASGFGIQYVVYLTPLLIFYRPWAGFIYSILAGIFLLSIYISFLTPEFPLRSIHNHTFSHSCAVIGFVLWLCTFIQLASFFENNKGYDVDSPLVESPGVK